MNDLVNINGKYRTIKQINTSNLKLLWTQVTIFNIDFNSMYIF